MKRSLLSLTLLCTSLLCACDAERKEAAQEAEAKRLYAEQHYLKFQNNKLDEMDEGELRSDFGIKWETLAQEEKNRYKPRIALSNLKLNK